MAGTCITTIKVLGASSLGLLSGSLVYQSIETIPLLINKLQYEVSISSNEILSQVKLIITTTRVSNVILGSISSGLLWLAYLASGARDKHPYIIYSTISVPIALASLYYKSYKYENKVLRKSTINVAPETAALVAEEVAPAAEEATVPAPPVVAEEKSDDETESLGKSYIHVSDSSSNSTPNSTTPSSPKSPQQPETETPQLLSISEATEELSIEQEVENALFKKEFVSDLQKVKAGYLVGSSITGLGFLMVVVGIIGDTYFL